jgi:nucleotide-binding universal stress UspA family protein
MFRNVHVGVDGGPTGRDAIRLATALAERGARLALVHIHGSELAPDDAPDLAFGATEPRDARKLLEAERDAARIDAELINGCAPSVGRGLRALAEKHAVDLLVVGSHPRGAASLLGDDTRAALNGAPCAVAIAPRDYTAPAAGLATVGVGYDYSVESQAALAAARALAARNGAKVEVLYVLALPHGASTTRSDAAEVLDEGRGYAQEQLSSLEGVDATASYGNPGEELAALSDRVDLLVIGSRSLGPVRRWLLGSTASHLAGHARCPLLVLGRTATIQAQIAAGHAGDSQAHLDTAP